MFVLIKVILEHRMLQILQEIVYLIAVIQIILIIALIIILVGKAGLLADGWIVAKTTIDVDFIITCRVQAQSRTFPIKGFGINNISFRKCIGDLWQIIMMMEDVTMITMDLTWIIIHSHSILIIGIEEGKNINSLVRDYH